MRKLIAGSAAALALIAAPALASGSPDSLRIGDRVGPTKGASKAFVPETVMMFIAFAAVTTLVVWHAEDEDDPVSA